ncbi:MAG: hypothetical protein ACTSSI_14810 [Candidatus Helarchaeota archaeon]
MSEYFLLLGLDIAILAGISICLIILIRYILKRQPKTPDLFDNKINDISNMLVILIALISDGTILFSKYQKPVQLDTAYLHSLISTVNLMARSIGEKAKLKKMEYDQKIIVIHHGKFVRGIILCNGNPSNYLEDSLTIVVKSFEDKFLEELQESKMDHLADFRQVEKIILDVFGKKLMEAMTVLWMETEEHQTLLSEEEIEILKIARALKNKQEYFTLPELVSISHKKINKNTRETLKIVDNLIARKYIVSFHE